MKFDRETSTDALNVPGTTRENDWTGGMMEGTPNAEEVRRITNAVDAQRGRYTLESIVATVLAVLNDGADHGDCVARHEAESYARSLRGQAHG